MIYPHQQNAINFITDKLREDIAVNALLISGSVSHGFNNENSDIDINIVISNELYEEKKAANKLTYWESAADFYEKGYFDGKYITLDYLALVGEKGNEPTRFALHDSKIAFDRTGMVENLLAKIGAYDVAHESETAIRLVSQLDAWKWYCDEALSKKNQYLLETSVLKLILFGGRLILLDNRIFFPYHKWFLKVLENVPKKPESLMCAIQRLIENKTVENIIQFYEMIKIHKDWSGGREYSWASNFVHDIELVWMRGNEFIENI